MAVAKSIQKLTEAEYLEIERRAEFKSEFFDGEMFAMAGTSRQHSLINANLIRELGTRLKGSGCIAYTSDLRVKVEASGLYTYPDVSVACGEQRFEDEQVDVLLNPVMIVEVLSESTEAYDRGEKFRLYRKLPSLREYLLVSQWKPHIEQYVRQPDEQWILRDVVGLKSQLESPSLGIAVSLEEVFAQVDFSLVPPRRDPPARS